MQHEPTWWRSAASLVLLAGLIFRAWPWLTAPLLPYEDGALFFAQCYAEFDWRTVVQPYAGYVPVGSNLQALLVCRLPTTWIAEAFVVSALLMSWGAAASVLRPAWQQVAPFGTRFIMAMAIAWVPFGSFLELTSLAYAQWPQLLWLFLLLAEPPAAERRSRLVGGGRLLLVAFLSLCNPLSVLLAPIAVRSLRHRAARWDVAVYLLATAGYVALIIVDGLSEAGLVFDSFLSDFLRALAGPVLIESFGGLECAMFMQDMGSWAPPAVAGIVAAILAFVVIRAWRMWPTHARAFVIGLAWLGVATLAASVVLRAGWVTSEQHVVRYAWPFRAAIWIALSLALATICRPWLAGVIVAVLGIGLSLGNAGMHCHRGSDGGLARFVADLAESERRLGHRRWVRARWQQPNGPPIVIRQR